MAIIISQQTAEVEVLTKKQIFHVCFFCYCAFLKVKVVDGEVSNREVVQDNTPGSEFVPLITKQVNDVLALPPEEVINFTGIDGTQKTFEIRDIVPMLITYFEKEAAEAEAALNP